MISITFIGVFLDKDNPSFEFDDKHVVIVVRKSFKNQVSVLWPTMIVLLPEKDFVMLP